MWSLLKLPFIVVVATSLHIIGNRPNPPVPMGERVGSKLRETVVLQMLEIKGVFWLLAVAETALILMENFCPGLIKIRDSSLYLTRVSAIGSLAVFTGAFIRLRCYEALGPLFTFELTVREDHKLIKHGPYSVVRHPSYSGVYLAFFGAISWFFTPGSLLHKSAGIGGSFAIFLSFLFLLATYLLFSRVNEEDKLLRQRFGAEWDDWARKVPYKLVPYIF